MINGILKINISIHFFFHLIMFTESSLPISVKEFNNRATPAFQRTSERIINDRKNGLFPISFRHTGILTLFAAIINAERRDALLRVQ